MFGWNVHTSQTANSITLFVPFHYCALCFVFLLGMFWLIAAWKKGRPVRNALMVLAALILLDFLGSASKLTLDATAGSATLVQFDNFHFSTHRWTLQQIDNVYVKDGRQSDMLRLQFADGVTRSLSLMDQYGGKEEVAFKMNRFLRDHRETSVTQ
jgi:hypothetical protein